MQNPDIQQHCWAHQYAKCDQAYVFAAMAYGYYKRTYSWTDRIYQHSAENRN